MPSSMSLPSMPVAIAAFTLYRVMAPISSESMVVA